MLYNVVKVLFHDKLMDHIATEHPNFVPEVKKETKREKRKHNFPKFMNVLLKDVTSRLQKFQIIKDIIVSILVKDHIFASIVELVSINVID